MPKTRYSHKNTNLHGDGLYVHPELPVFCSNSVRNDGYLYMLPLSMTNKQTFRFGEQKETHTMQVRL